VLFLMACASEEGVAPLGGTVTAETGESATVSAATAYGVRVGEVAGIVVSPNPETTCADAAAFVLGNDPDFNYGVVSGEGVCSLYVRLDAYEGASATLTDDPAATIALNCAMDEGEWAFEDRTEEGYYYSGPWWVGSPEGYTLAVSGGDDADFAVELEMDTYYGRFPYDNEEPEADPASGAVAGGFTATWCEDMGPAFN
jgi:hypothetical protein